MLLTKTFKPNLVFSLFVIAGIVLLSVFALTHTPQTEGAGPDLNGYTAQYECRAGNPNCNVDVVGLTQQACQVTVTANDTNWNKITGDTTKTVYCIEAGDHTAKGTLTLSFSGTANARKILRYTRANDNDDEPWKQSSVNQAKVGEIVVEASYWIIHRLAFPSVDVNYGDRISCDSGANCNNTIINRILIEGMSAGFTYAYGGIKFRSGDNVTIQNSVIRNSWGKSGSEPMGVTPTQGTGINFRIVNNEIYDWSAHPIQTGNNNHPLIEGIVVENNDIYVTSSMYVESGTRSRAKNTVSIKNDSTATNPTRYIHNRLWGVRSSTRNDANINTDLGACFNGSVGDTTNLGSYHLFLNNICTDSQYGFNCSNGKCDRGSFVGNLVYNINNHTGTSGASAIEGSNFPDSEIYLNTIISVLDEESIHIDGTNEDVRCNVTVDSQNFKGPLGSGSQAANNTYYGVSGTKPDTTKLDNPLTTRSNSTSYSVNQIIRLSSTPTTSCTGATDPDCFLYKVTQAGTSASSQPSYCTTANCITTDGGMKVQAIRGPYTFYRKLKTSPELFTIPYATPYSSAPESGFCPTSTGTRSGVGVSDAGIF